MVGIHQLGVVVSADGIVIIVVQAVHGIHIRAPAEEPLEELRLDTRALPGKVVKDRIGCRMAVALRPSVEVAVVALLIVAQLPQDQPGGTQDQRGTGQDRQHEGQELEAPVISVFHLSTSIL